MTMTPIITAAIQPKRHTIRSGIAGILTATALLGAIACSGSDSSTGPSDENPVGTYGLSQVAQKKIPAVIFRGPYTFPNGAAYDRFTITVTGGEIILDDDGDLHVAIDYKAAADGNEVSGTSSDDGTYEIDGDEIYVSSGDGGGVVGSYRNGVISLDLDVFGTGEPVTFAFRRAP